MIHTPGMSYKKRFIRNDFETSLNFVKIKKQKLYSREILRNGFLRITSLQGNLRNDLLRRTSPKENCKKHQERFPYQMINLPMDLVLDENVQHTFQ